jgi:hypothetical protein
VYAPDLLSCTNYGSFKSTWSWGAYFYFTCYISPTSTASSIQQAYRLYLIWENPHILPCLCGPYKFWPSYNVAAEEWAAKLNASYCSTLVIMYWGWAPFPLADLVSYLSGLQSQDVTTWPPLSSDWDTLQWEYNTQQVLLTCHWE